MSVMSNQESRFHLTGEQDAFKHKAGDLFSALDDVSYTPTQETDSFLKGDPEQNTERFKTGNGNKRRGSQTARGGTDRAMMPPPRMRTVKRRDINQHAIPEHVQNPSKFTKYSLADVKESDMSQKSNTAAAMAFLREIDERRAEEEKGEEDEGRIIFRKPARKAASQPKETEPKPSCDEPSNSDTQKAEQQGQKKPRSKKKQSVVLSHLEYEDE